MGTRATIITFMVFFKLFRKLSILSETIMLESLGYITASIEVINRA